MTRRQPYAHNLEVPATASPEPDDKIDEIEIILEDETPLQTSDESVKKDEKPDSTTVTADSIITPETSKPSADDEAYTRLKNQLDREKSAREAAQRRSEQLENDHRSTQERLRQEQERQQALQLEHYEAQSVAIDNAISFSESQAAQAQREITRALSEGDYEASSNAYRALAKAESDLSRLKDGKFAIEAQKKAPVQRYEPAQPVQTPQPQSTYERVEAYITQPAHSPRAQQYMRDHYDDLFRDFDNGAQKLNKLLGAHYLAKGDGVIENSDAYYDYLDRHMGYKQDPAPQKTAPTPAPAPKKAIPPSAPVSRGDAGGSGSSTSITLSRAEVDFCNASGIKPADYARSKLAAIKGANDPNYSGPRFTNDR